MLWNLLFGDLVQCYLYGRDLETLKLKRYPDVTVIQSDHCERFHFIHYIYMIHK